MQTKEHVLAMVRALRETGLFTITEDYEAGTVNAFHTSSNREVFAAIEKGENEPWIIRHHRKLFC